MADHGGAGTRYAAGCRCDECRAAHAARVKRRKDERVAKPLPDTVEHGTQSTYNNWSCRCTRCCYAHGKYMNDYRVKRKSANV